MAQARRLRLFVAIELPDAWRELLVKESRALESTAPGFARWVDPALMHVTLVFLGGQDPAILPAIEAAVDAAAAESEPFELRLTAPGSFGGRRSLRVIWVGIEDRPAGALGRLQRSVAGQLRAAKVDFDDSPFRAHITLGRAKRVTTPIQSEAMHAAIARRGARPILPKIPAFECADITLVRSDLRPTGPIYTPLRKSEIGG